VTTLLRDQVAAAIKDALARASKELGWPDLEGVTVDVERPANPEHGDYASNVALKLAKQVRKPPRDIAKAIGERVRIASPIAAVEDLSGFVNVRLDPKWLPPPVDEIERGRVLDEPVGVVASGLPPVAIDGGTTVAASSGMICTFPNVRSLAAAVRRAWPPFEQVMSPNTAPALADNPTTNIIGSPPSRLLPMWPIGA